MKKITQKIISVLGICCTLTFVAAQNLAAANTTLKADVVVVGAGAAGFAAALQAKQLGLDVILLEKNAFVGGTTNVAEGMFAVGSHLQKEAGITLTSSDILKGVLNYHHYVVDALLCKKYFDSSAANIDWLESLGVKFSKVDTTGDTVRTWHLYEGTGSQYMKTMNAAAEKAGITIMLETPGKKLIMRNGKVAGIVATTKGGKNLTINTPVVILATGGYSDNPEMIRKFANIDPKHAMSIGLPGRTGDGIAMGLSAGADTVNIGTLMYAGANLKGSPFDSDLCHAVANQPTMVLVNDKGVRFVDETLASSNFVYFGNACKIQKRTLCIMNKANLDNLVQHGSVIELGVYLKAGQKLDKIWAQLDEQVKKGNKDIYSADTVGGLAKKMDVDPAALTNTIDIYNKECSEGKDLEFGKKADYLASLADGPYYGFELSLCYLSTVGGLKVTSNAQVVNVKGAVIPGLYATGSDAGGLYGESYDLGTAAGSQQGWAVASGRFAAQDAAHYLKK